MYTKEKTFLSIKREYLKAADGKVKIKQATKEQLAEIRNKVIATRKKNNFILALSTILAITIMGFLYVKLIDNQPFSEPKLSTEEVLNEASNYNDYLFYIEDGDKWFEEHKYLSIQNGIEIISW